MTDERPLLPHETATIGAGDYRWFADGRPLPITEHWQILRAASGYLFDTVTDASAASEFRHHYRATLSLDADARTTGLAMTVTKGEVTVEVAVHLEADGAVITRARTNIAEGAVQRTQTFRMEEGSTLEAHPVLFDGLHIAACDRAMIGPYRRPCLWLDLLTDDVQGLMAARPTVYVIDRRETMAGETYAITRWGNDLEMAESLISVKTVGQWIVPTELRFTMAGVLYSVYLVNEQWEE